MARLLLASPEGQVVVELGPHNTLGRHPSNSIQLLDKIVSKEHCIIEQRAGQYVLRDLGSLNGTYVNGERVNGERTLHHADEIALGGTRGRFDDGTGAPVLPPQARPEADPGLWRPADSATRPGSGPMSQRQSDQFATSPALSSHVVPQVTAPQVTAPQVTGPRATAPLPVVPFGPVSNRYTTPLSAAVPPGDGSVGAGGLRGTRVNVYDHARAIGTQITATQRGFLPFDQVKDNSLQLAADYERLRLSHELSREIALERDLPSLLNKILLTIFKFVHADRGVIFLMDAGRKLVPSASLRRDGTDAPINVSSTIMNHVITERATVLTHDAAMDFAASKGKSMILNRISSAIVAPLLHDDEILGVLWLDSETLAQFQQKDLEMVTAIAAQAAMFIEITILGKKIEQEIVHRERFSRLLSPNIAQRVMSGELEIKKGGQLVHHCTVFNSDIRGFTPMSAGARPENLVEMLNEYFEQMVEMVFKYEGTLDKFMGDGIMALWGAPVAHPDDAVRCVCSALEQLEVLEAFNRRQNELDLPPLAVGFGIHTGPVVAGYIGSSKALSYTVIGDTANTSARLCGIALGGQILVSEQTLAQLNNRFDYEELPPAQLKGKEKPFRVFNIARLAPRVQVPEDIAP
ncbi:MAG: FHA domain-containing protein [Polyangiaceae bacterium]|nr:FHA domain-containing protein [Polyangiaceae bacterium]